MINTIFNQNKFEILTQKEDISTSIPSRGMFGFLFSNVTPYFFTVTDMLGNTIASLAPWTVITGSIAQPTDEVTITSQVQLPSVQVTNADYTTWAFQYELSTREQPVNITQLSVAAAANVNATIEGGNIAATVVGGVDANITNSSLDANVTNAKLTVDGTVDANITNSQVPVTNVAGSTFNVQTSAGSETTVTNQVSMVLDKSNVTLDSNSTILNEQIKTTNIIKKQVTLDVRNLAPGSTQGSGDVTFDECFLDGYHVFIVSENGLYTSYEVEPNAGGVWLSDGEIGPSQYGAFCSTAVVSPLSSRSSGVDFGYFSITPAPVIGGLFNLNIKNISSTTIISDTITLTIYGSLTSETIVNDTSNPVNTSGIPGSHSASGNTTLPASTSTQIVGTANKTITRLILSFYNSETTTLFSGSRCFVIINGATSIVIPLGNLAAGDFSQPFEFDFGEGIVTDSSGIQLDPNADMAVYSMVVTK